MNRQTAALTLVLVLLTVFATAFALINFNNRVRVWPLNGFQPLTLIIGASFVLGACVSALLVSLLHRRQGRLTSVGSPRPDAARERQQTGRV